MACVRPARAGDEAVRISCPELTTERAAELESRLRANLLTSEPAVTVQVTCQPAKTEVLVASATDSITVGAPAASIDTFRDDVLRAVEEALQTLAQRSTRAVPGPTNDAASQPAPAAPAEPASPSPVIAAPMPPVSTPALAAKPRQASRSWTELFGQLLGEAWHGPLALGGALGVARSTPVLWYGLRTAVLRPAAQDSDFSATEWHASAELGAQPAFAAGVRATLGLGPSVLFVTPHGSLTARTRKAASALFFDARLSRPFWFGHWALLPELGVRLFTRDRGVRIDSQERLNVHGFVPQLGVGIVYRAD